MASTPGLYLFVDDSGSTSNVATYWTLVSSIYENNKNNISEIVMWDNSTKKVKPKEFLDIVKLKCGRNGGTSPQSVAKYIIDNQIKENIILITDGQVSESNVTETDRLLSGYANGVDKVQCYIIGPPSSMNMSVTCPFTRENTSTVYVNEILQVSHNAQDFEYLKTIDSISYDDFMAKYDELESMLVALNMGKAANIEMHSKLVKLKTKLIRHLAALTTNNTSTQSNVELLTTAVRTHQIDDAVIYARNISHEYFNSLEGDLASTFDKKMNYLISLCGDLRGMYTIDAIRKSKMNRTTALPVVQATEENQDNDDDDDNTSNQYTFECPILLDNDIPFIPILAATTGDGGDSSATAVLHSGIDDKIKKDIEMNPLRILSYPELVHTIASRFGHAIGQQASIALSDNAMNITSYSTISNHGVDPYTRRSIIGYLALGNHDSHVKSSNYYMAMMMNGTPKLIGNIHLYFTAIWYIILYTDKVLYLSNGDGNIKTPLINHLKYRFLNHQTRACLSGNPQFILTYMPIDIAVWFLLSSGLLNQPPSRDALRLLIHSIEPLIIIMSDVVFGYILPSKAIKHIHLTQVLLTLLSYIKKNEIKFKNYILGLSQHTVSIDVSKVTQTNDVLVDLIPLDGPATTQQIQHIMTTYFNHPYFKNVSLVELVALAKKVGANFSASDIPLSADWEPVEDITTGGNASAGAPQSLYAMEWAYGYKTDFMPHDISPLTFRPYYYVHPPVNVTATASTGTTSTVNNAAMTMTTTSSSTTTPPLPPVEGLITWMSAAELVYGLPIKQMLSAYRAHLNYFLTHSHFPNYESFMIYCYNRYCIYSLHPHRSLPYGMTELYESVRLSYEPLLALNLTSEEIKKRITSSMDIETRIKVEIKRE